MVSKVLILLLALSSNLSFLIASNQSPVGIETDFFSAETDILNTIPPEEDSDGEAVQVDLKKFNDEKKNNYGIGIVEPIDSDEEENYEDGKEDVQGQSELLDTKETPEVEIGIPVSDNDLNNNISMDYDAYKAALELNLEDLKVFANENVSFDIFDRKSGETPLHAASRRGDVEIFKFIASKVKNLNPINRMGRSPFAVSIIFGNSDLAYFMIKASRLFDLETVDLDGRTPLMLAGLYERSIIFSVLMYRGHDLLVRDNSGRSLLTLLPPTHSMYKKFIFFVKNRCLKDKAGVIRRIAPEITTLYRNGESSRVFELLSELSLSLSDLVSVPQYQSYNLLRAILDMKEYTLYRSIVDDETVKFDINDSEASLPYDEFSFFDRFLQCGTLEAINYLLKFDKPTITIRSFVSIFKYDRLKVFKLIETAGSKFHVKPVKLLVRAGLERANKCFSYLKSKFSNPNFTHLEFTNIFCEAACKISHKAKDINVIKNLLETFSKELETCSSDEIDFMKNNIPLMDASRRDKHQVCGFFDEILYKNQNH